MLFLGYALRDLKRPADSANAFRRARGVFEALLDQPDWALIARQRMGDCDNGLGLTAFEAGDRDRAMAYFESAHGARRRLLEQNPTVHTYRAELASTCLNLAVVHRGCGAAYRAAELSNEACAQAEELVSRDPADFHFRSLAIRAHRVASGDAETGGDFRAAARHRVRCRELLRDLAAPVDPAAWPEPARDALKDGLRQLRWGQWLAATESLRHALVCLHRANRPLQPPDQRASASRQ
jgi:hypothetical protein